MMIAGYPRVEYHETIACLLDSKNDLVPDTLIQESVHNAGL